jgi:ferredoxin
VSQRRAATVEEVGEPEVRSGTLLRLGEGLFLAIDRWAERWLPARMNPFQQTGAIATTAILVAVASGILELFWYSSSVHLAYDSVLAMGDKPLTAGLVRSVHRYSSDAAIFFMLVHAVRLFFERRFTGPRWLAWLTGTLSFFVMWFVGWLGYWLVWDERAHGVATGTAKMLDVLPIFVDPLERSLLTDEGINSLLFFVVFFFHMLIPLVLAIILWIHVSRLSRPTWITDRPMTACVVVTLVLVSLVYPANQAAPAQMSQLAHSFTMDWWYLAPLVLTERLGGGALWLLILVVGSVVASLPWTLTRGQRHRADTVVISRDNPRSYGLVQTVGESMACNACRSCYEDCPYDAIEMVPRTDGANYAEQPVVLTSQCVSCGICAGACDSAGIGLPWFDALQVRRQVDQWVAEEGTSILIGCAESAAGALVVDEQGVCADIPGFRVLKVPCSGWVNSTLVDRAIRRGAAGVLIATCEPGSCRYVEGAQLASDRLSGGGEPPQHSDEGQVRVVGMDRTRTRQLVSLAGAFSARGPLEDPHRAGPTTRGLAAVLVAAGLAAVFTLVSDLRYASPVTTDSELVVTFKHPGQLTENCRPLTDEEMNAKPVHMRPAAEICDRRRAPVRLRVAIDGSWRETQVYEPAGIWKDGISIVVYRIPLDAGQHDVQVAVGDGPGEGWDYSDGDTVRFVAGQRRVVTFERVTGFEWY